MNARIKLYSLWSFAIFGAMLTLFSCQKWDDYKKYIEDGEVIYPAKADSVKVRPGYNRIQLAWKRTDPKVVGYTIYWNLGKDSMLVEAPAPDASFKSDSIKVRVEGLEESTYEFAIVSFDQFKNKSVKSNVSGKAFGDNYKGTLLSRGVKDIAVSAADKTAAITWASSDSTDVGVELTYIQTNGVAKTTIFGRTADDLTVLENYKLGTDFSYRTIYSPELTSIDMFYTEAIHVDAPLVIYPDLNKSLFSSYVLPGDISSAHGWLLPYAWDGQLAEGRGFHTPDATFPMKFTIDLGVTAIIHQLKLWQREAGNSYFNEGNPKKIEIWGSTNPNSDGSDNGWSKLGEFTSVKPSGLPLGQLDDRDRAVASGGEVFTFANPTEPVRYIRFKILEIWKPGRFSAHVMELGFKGDIQ